MKTMLTLAFGFGLGLSGFGQTRPGAAIASEPTDYSISGRGPNHRTWERTVYEPGPDGRLIPRQQSYQELATGMHYLKDGKWEESKEEIEIFPDGAIARQGQHRVIFAPNLATEGAIDLETPTGDRLRSHIIGLSYWDEANGLSVMISEIKDSIGEVVPPNQVLYSDAFTDLDGDVRYIYSRGGFEQSVILRAMPPPPESFGLNPRTTKLQVLTEFISPPVPERELVLSERTPDEHLNFGGWRFVEGRAYAQPGTAEVALGGGRMEDSATITKQWRKLEGRDFLIEEIPLARIATQLDALPRRQAARPPPARPERLVASTTRYLPPRPPRLDSQSPRPRMELAQATTGAGKPGFVLDYITHNGYLTNYTFQADQTFFITGPVYVYGTCVLEGGAVLKYAAWTGQWYLDPHVKVNGTFDLRTGPYRPAVFTAKDDNSVGLPISGSTGAPSGFYSYTALHLDNIAHPLDIHDLRSSHTLFGLVVKNAWGPVVLRDSQFVRNHTGSYVDYCWAVHYRNLLYHKSAYRAVDSDYSTATAENLTIHEASASLARGTLSATNCLFIWVTNWPTGFTSYNNVTNNNSATFQTVGAGSHYLATNSPYRNAGITNISTNMLAGLKLKTTYPPILFASQQLTNSMTFFPQAQRDTDTPDLGYHYDPLDYGFSHVWFKNATMRVLPGTTFGTSAVSSGGFGISLMAGSVTLCEGTPVNPNWIVSLNSVQEQTPTNILFKQPCVIGEYMGQSPAPQASFRFTKWARPARDSTLFQDWYQDMEVAFRDCEFHGGQFQSFYPDIRLTNSLFNRVQLHFDDFSVGVPLTMDVFNCLFYGGSLWLDHWETGAWQFRDNAFMHVAITNYGNTINSNNAYLNTSTNTDNRLLPTHASNCTGSA